MDNYERIDKEIKTLVKGIVSYRKRQGDLTEDELDRYKERLTAYAQRAVNREFKTSLECRLNMNCILTFANTCTDVADVKEYIRNSEFARAVLGVFHEPYLTFLAEFTTIAEVEKAHQLIQEYLSAFPQPTERASGKEGTK